VSPTGLLNFPSPTPVVAPNSTSYPAIRNNTGEHGHFDNMFFRFCDLNLNPVQAHHPISRSLQGCCSPVL